MLVMLALIALVHGCAHLDRSIVRAKMDEIKLLEAEAIAGATLSATSISNKGLVEKTSLSRGEIKELLSILKGSREYAPQHPVVKYHSDLRTTMSKPVGSIRFELSPTTNQGVHIHFHRGVFTIGPTYRSDELETFLEKVLKVSQDQH